ncbi:MAG: S8 family serine peptidase [Gammaproteobacteria bacterium]
MTHFTPKLTPLRGAAAALCVTLCAGAQGDVTWQLYDRQCALDNVEEQFACGNYGRFYLNGASPTESCDVIAEGSDNSLPYFAVRNVEPFPSVPVVPAGQRAATASATALTQHPLQLIDQTPFPSAIPWLAMIDFAGAHGNSVHWLAQAVAGSGIASRTILLDDPDQNPDGNVTDLDVLRSLCQVANVAQRAPHLRPVVNMSFGRPIADTDPVNTMTCSGPQFSCQILRVTQHLAQRDALLVAAGGKQRETLFPAALETVIAAGQLDPSEFVLTKNAQATWEMPAGTNALMPGNGLCIRGGWSAPSGASYASAFLAGWLAFAASDNPGFDLHTGVLQPIHSPARNCHVLGTDSGGELSACNAYVEEVFQGIGGQYQSGCWSNPIDLSAHVALGTPTVEQPEAVGAVTWNAQVRPAPEGDPCVPCTGSNFARNAPDTGDLTINLASTLPMRPNLAIESVHVRVDALFYPLLASADVLSALHAGQVDELVLKNAAPLVTQAGSASLFFQLRDTSAASCSDLVDGEAGCAWMATHIHTF